MPGSILGTSVRRVEDRDLITGASTYVGNLALPGLLHLAFVRSPLAHGRISGIDTVQAAAAPGVVAVYTAADLDLPAHHGLFVLNPELPRPPSSTGATTSPRASAPIPPRTRSPTPRSWSGRAWSTSGWRSCRWRATR